MALSAFRTAIWIPYPTANPGHGFWGEQTSTLNFCEEDYALSSYCAEFCNTVTNAIFMWLGVRGIINCVQQGHPSIFLISYIGYMVVGLGSILFHTTLKSAQVYYHITKDPIFHQTAYAALTATIVFRSMWVMESQLRPVLSARDPEKASYVLNTMWTMVATGLSIFLGGFLIWNLDNVFCSQVRQWRHAVGLPWAVLLEGHAWWHLMTGLASRQTPNAYSANSPLTMASPSPQGRSFTVRGVAAGLAVGTIICAANMYFGLQTGWVSIMSMPSSLMGFAVFKLLKPHLRFPFSPVENVLVQSVAGGMAIMPLGCGFVGVIPAMNYLLEPNEQGPLSLSTWQLIIWSLGLCYFGVVFAVPFGFSTAVLIRVLHSRGQKSSPQELDAATKGGFASLAAKDDESALVEDAEEEEGEPEVSKDLDWAYNMRLLLLSFLVSGIFTICNYFLPILRDLPVFGTVAASTWLWTLNPSLAYVGQGIIMGTETTLHMTLGAIIGWGVLSPLAKVKGWAPGPVDDWENGSKGWIVWVSLAIMLVDAVVSLAYIALRPVFTTHALPALAVLQRRFRHSRIASLFRTSHQYSPIPSEAQEEEEQEHGGEDDQTSPAQAEDRGLDDAPTDQQIHNKVVFWGLLASILVCVLSTQIVFGHLVPLYAIVIAVLMALVLSIMGVRALGETDLNPVSGISKLAQLFFALIIPQSNKSSVLINLVAGAISEAGALQAGDLMQDLKTGHLLGAAPKAQFWGQLIGATFGAVFSAFAYRIYTAVYEIPGKLFQVPTAYVWIFTARLVTGQGLPYMAKEWATGAGVLFAVTTLARTLSVGRPWRSWIPGGIAVAVGMYNVPSFTLARAIGGIVSWYWLSVRKQSTTPLIIIASGFILGEGFLSIVNLWLQALKVPHY
ncbi:uncharacterized protein Triagg1_6310 [Trichoderma aggressivum f. europaeum]|uniref:Oligopeptide transporter n=1 Tax=Trichoderma aggressivum f. europaeum TaxID=173218 RepID=A0AAE1IDH6_9HYPO|nr:hypothetical protein Triagg1_6310 [Trichoderma aggressivum f. europaeum]